MATKPLSVQNPMSSHDIENAVRETLAEDVGTGDLTASLIDAGRLVEAKVISRQQAILCGCAWFSEVFRQLDPAIDLDWQATDGDQINPDQSICFLRGRAQPILTGERSALNWLQTLSGTATVARQYADRVSGTQAKVLDTRKTLPGLRMAQKYAVRCGGGYNHRVGLFDGILIKENHLRSGDSIASVLKRAIGQAPQGVFIEIEVDNVEQLKAALEAGAKRVLLDNFSLEETRRAVEINQRRAELEASGNITLENIHAVAATGVDYISIGALTKHVTAVDLSMEFEG